MFLDLIRKRRSIRKYQKRGVEAEKLEALVEAALRSPSSRGYNPWEFVLVQDKGLLEKLSQAKKHGSSFLGEAPAGIVVCADPSKSDVWVEDAAIASIFIHLAAVSLNLGSCWVQIRDRVHDGQTAEDYVREVLGIPSSLKVLAIIGLGYPAEEKSPHPRKSLPYEKAHSETYGRRFPVSER